MSDAKNDIFYVASLIEYVARKTKNRRCDIARIIGIDGLRQSFQVASVNHCLTFEQVSDEMIEDYDIPEGEFFPEGKTTAPPSYLGIGQNYANIVAGAQPDTDKYPDELYRVFCSKISDWMTDYSTAFYYSPRDYLLLEYQELCGEG